MSSLPSNRRSVSRRISKLIALLLVYALLVQCVPMFSRVTYANSLPVESLRDSMLNRTPFKSALDKELSSVLTPEPPVAETIKDAVVSRHRPTLTNGLIEGSLRVLLGE